jgi:EmrB/QacA subfamily drug resistance transporter
MSTVSLKSTAGKWVLVATILASGMAFLDGSVVTVALPTLQRELHLTFGGLQWIVNAYLITLASLILTAGALGDSFGRKKVFLIGIAVFTLGSLFCALSRTELLLVLSRAFQGIGGALMIPGSLALIRASIDPGEQGKAIGLWAGYGGGLAALGPLAGGWLVEQFGWPSIFLINLPLGVIAWLLTQRFIEESRGQTTATIDWWGTVSTVLGLAGLSYGLIQGPTVGWTPVTVGILIVGLVGLGAFVVVERRTNHPMVPFQLFRQSTVVGANVATLLIYGALATVLLFVVLDLQQVRGFSPIASRTV